jgi:imidazolonepropionase-like amidohydrolase
VTIIPAITAGIADRVGSLEVGKDADIIVTSGDPIDPRCRYDAVWVNGEPVYDAERDGRAW